jgi:predicted acylesterase/phospholipase RssA
MATCTPYKLSVRKLDSLVIAGGGAKSMAGLGAIHILRKNGHLKDLRTVAGTSAGAIVATGVALNRNCVEMCKAFANEIYVPSIDIGNFSNAFGIDSGAHLSRWIDIVLGDRSHTFKSIYEETGMTLIICATNMSTLSAKYFSPTETPDFDVKTAIRMSCSLPIFFSAVRHEGEVYVDGALTDAFPIDYVAGLENVHHVLGIRYESVEYSATKDINSIDKFLTSLIAISTRDRYSPDSNVISIDVGKITVLDFKNPKVLKKAFKIGATKMTDILKKIE